MDTRNQELEQQLQTSNQLSRLQTAVFCLRTSVERNHSTDSRDAENLRNLREEHVSLAPEKLWQSAEIE